MRTCRRLGASDLAAGGFRSRSHGRASVGWACGCWLRPRSPGRGCETGVRRFGHLGSRLSHQRWFARTPFHLSKGTREFYVRPMTFPTGCRRSNAPPGSRTPMTPPVSNSANLGASARLGQEESSDDPMESRGTDCPRRRLTRPRRPNERRAVPPVATLTGWFPRPVAPAADRDT